MKTTPSRRADPAPVRAGVALLLLAAAAPVGAQSNEDISSVLQFNFSNPGARSLGMGGAFAARADDATAVYANPAGLSQLSRPEFMIEGRGWSFANRFLDGGTQQSVSSLDGLIYDETDDSTAGLSFLSGFYPGQSGRWVVGVFYHAAVNFETALATDEATVLTAFGTTGFARPRDGELELAIDTFGASFAIELPANFAIGATVTTSDFDFHSRLELYDAPRDQEIGDPVSNPFSLDDPTPGLTEGDPQICCRYGNRGDIIRLRTQDGEDDALGYALGVFWHSKALREGLPLWSIGAVFREGPKFDFTGRSWLRSLAPTVSLPTTRSYVAVVADGRGVFDVPDVFGLGASFRPSSRWILSADWARVRYGDLMHEFLDLVARDSNIPDGQTGTPLDYHLEDGDEYRLGAEFVVNPQAAAPLIFVRAGAWHDPNHEIEYVGPDPTQRPVFSPGEDELHGALGVGLKFRDWQLDSAADFSDRLNTFSLSAVFYLGRD